MYFRFWIPLFVFLLIVNDSLQKEESKKEKHRKTKKNHRFHFGHLAKDAATEVAQTISGVNSSNTDSTDNPVTNPQGSGNDDTGPVLFAGEPSVTSSTTPRVFLYNTTAPPVDDHVDARKRTLGNFKKASRLEKHKKHNGKNKKRSEKVSNNKEE